jgi:hypothetical protein
MRARNAFTLSAACDFCPLPLAYLSRVSVMPMSLIAIECFHANMHAITTAERSRAANQSCHFHFPFHRYRVASSVPFVLSNVDSVGIAVVPHLKKINLWDMKYFSKHTKITS